MGGRRGSVAAALLVVWCSACSGPGRFDAPTDLRTCWSNAYDRGSSSGDTDSSWTMAFSESSRALGASGTIHLCVPDDLHARITTEVPEGVEVDRVSIVVGDGTDLPFPELRVTVTTRVDDPVRVTYDYGPGGTSHVDIEVDDGRWSFRNPFA